MNSVVEPSYERLFEYLHDVEDTLTSIHRKLAQDVPPEPQDIQCDIAGAVVLLYGLRQNYCFDQSATNRDEPHPMVLSGCRTNGGWKAHMLEDMVARAACGSFAAGAD